MLRHVLRGNVLQLNRFWDVSSKRTFAMARLARGLGGVNIDVAQSFGLFCDVGIPLLMYRFPDYGQTLNICNNEAQEWPRLFEQHSPTFKWTPSRLQKVQSYPNGVTRGVPGISFYAASASFGCICWYCVSGVSRPRLECGLSLLYQSRYWAMQVRAAPTLS
jgi:hypothetical protein